MATKQLESLSERIQDDDEDKLLTENQTADLMTIQPQTLSVWRTTKRYDLPYVKIGRAVRYRRSDVMAFIESRMVTSE
jgi:predicted DNA-binding transcriptional regulator AlpA